MVTILYISSRLEKIPRNLTIIVRDLFRTAVCIKPRLIQNGLELFKRRNSTDVVKDMEALAKQSKFWFAK